MSDEIHLDGRLRPVYEYPAAFVSSVSAAVISAMPTLSGLPQSACYSLSAAMCGFAAAQFMNGRRLRNYQQSLRTLDAYAMTSEDIPVSDKRFWLGKGFDVTIDHVQRVYEALKPGSKKYIYPSKRYKQVRGFCDSYTENNGNSRFMTPIAKWLSSRYLFELAGIKFLRNPYAPLPPVGGDPFLHGIGYEDEEDIYVPLESMKANVLILGTTGVGKTRAAEVFISSDIARKTRRKRKRYLPDGTIKEDTVFDADGCVVVADPKGDAALLARCYSEAKRHGRPFYVFHLDATDISCRYNAIGNYSRLSEVATRVSSQLDTGGDGAFKEFAWRFVNIIASTEVEMGDRPTFDSIRRALMDMESLYLKYCRHFMQKYGAPDWRDSLAALESKVKVPPKMKSMSKEVVAFHVLIDDLLASDPSIDRRVYEAVVNAVRYDPSYFSKITASALPLLEKLCGQNVIDLLSPINSADEDRPVLEWAQVAREKAVVYCGFAAMTDRDVASAVSNSMLNDLLSLAGMINTSGINYGMYGSHSDDKPRIYLHLDEVNEMCGSEMIPILNKARGSGVILYAYTQSRKDLEARLGDAAKAQVMEANFNTILMFRVKTSDTAELLTDQLKEVNVYDIGLTNAVTADAEVALGHAHRGITTRVSDAVSVSDKRKLVTPEQIIALPKGQAYALVDGSRVVKLRFPLPKESASTLPPTIQALCSKMREQYRSYDDWWDKAA